MFDDLVFVWILGVLIDLFCYLYCLFDYGWWFELVIWGIY